MEPASGFCEEDKDLDFYDFEPLPTLPEDEVSPLPAEGSAGVQGAALGSRASPQPWTQAPSWVGHRCPLPQRPRGPSLTAPVPQAHIYSLGATLKAALDYAVEPEPEPRLSAELETLLSQMQAEEPADRPRLESVIALCREKTRPASSCHLCRSLSAVGRRVLSIESFGALQDMSDSTWKAVPVPRSVGPRRPPGDLGTDLEGLPQPPISGEPSLRHRPLPPKPLPSAPMKNGDSHCQEGLASLVLGPLSPLGELDRDLLKRSHLQRTHTSPRLLPEGPEATASGPGAQLPPPASSPAGPRKAVLDGRNGLSRGKELEQEPQPQHTGAPGPGFSGDGGPKSSRSSQGPAEQRSLPCPEATQGEGGVTCHAPRKSPSLLPQDLSLQDLLCKLGRPFREYELWALCLACLRALQVPTEPPAYLCPDSVLVAEDGTVLLRPAPDNGPRDSFFLAPEAAEQKLVTEKASMYCVAAVLWTAAKFSVPRDHKLTLPRRLRTLLLDMARRCAPERPSAAEAIKVCGSYLLQRGMDSRKILAHLRASTCKVRREAPQCGVGGASSRRPLLSVGFLPVVGSDARLLVVPGPVPAPPSCDSGAQELPAAFTSEATHFRPVVLAQDAGEARERLTSSPGLAESPKDKEGEGWPGTQVLSEAPSLKTADLPNTQSPGPQGVAADPPRGSWGCPSLCRGGAAALQAPTPGPCPRIKGMEGAGPFPVGTLPPKNPTLGRTAGHGNPRRWAVGGRHQLGLRPAGSEMRSMLSKLRGQLEEMRAKVQLLGLVKKYLQVLYAERWGLEPCALPAIVNIAATPGDTLDFSPLDESSSLIFYNVSKQPGGGRQKAARVLQAGTPLGLMAYLYSSNAFLEGYVQQFLYTFRYFCTPHDFLHFLLDRISSTLSRAHQDPSSTLTKIYRRSLCVLQAWLEDCYTVDFTRNTELLRQLQDFLSSKILPLDGSAEHLLGLLEVGMDRRAEGAPRGMDLEDPKEAEEDTSPFNALCKRLSEDGISRKGFPWRLPRGNGLALPQHKRRPYSIASALPKPCFCEDFYGPYSKASEKGPYFLTEYSTRQLFTQLTLLQQELFQKCHPVHFLNSRALGVTDKSTAIPKASASEPLSAKPCSLFLSSCPHDRYLLQLLRHADDVGTWVAAEIATSHTPKLQVNLLSRFLLIAKSCYEQRNFATAMQILGGLEHLAVRQSPAWRILPAKMAEIMEELKAVEVFLKSDSLCLMEGRRFRAQPTLPSARLLAMHVQQLETGGFTMTNGAHRWSKLRSIARVVSQVHAFQENPYTFSPDPKLQAHLRRRIARFSGADVAVLAADSRANSLPVPSEKHARKIQDKLRRMKATFQ
uniref:Kinase non-catalytic C-lobe domain containing 1 n=1 Tax=Oryctolagus cuniculus TaxID=9986 RepID=G1U4G0_RABIT